MGKGSGEVGLSRCFVVPERSDVYKRQEESYGYLSGGHVRDKDAVNATLLVCEAAAWYAPVSYTHLDVYKRQGNRGREGRP